MLCAWALNLSSLSSMTPRYLNVKTFSKGVLPIVSDGKFCCLMNFLEPKVIIFVLDILTVSLFLLHQSDRLLIVKVLC